jgi:ABC-2 type transport system ATP-binding protein
VQVRTPRPGELTRLLAAEGVSIESAEQGVLQIRGLAAPDIGDRALAAGIALHELTVLRPSLEEAFMSLTRDEREYRTDDPEQEVAA